MKTPLAVSLSVMLLMPFSVVAETSSGGSSVSQPERTVALTRSCMAKVRAPGKYAVALNKPIPDVIADVGGTSSGAHNVQDCLHDALNVHYPLDLDTVEANGATTSGTNFYCPRYAAVLYGGSQYCRL